MKDVPPNNRWRGLDAVERVTCLLMVVALATLVVGVNLQVCARYLLNCSLSWTQELVQYAFVWMVFIGAGVGVRRGLHLRIDLFGSRLSVSARRRLAIAIDLVCLTVALVFVIAGAMVAWRTWQHTSPALSLPMGCVYLVFPLGGLGLLLFLLESIVQQARPRNDGPAEEGDPE